MQYFQRRVTLFDIENRPKTSDSITSFPLPNRISEHPGPRGLSLTHNRPCNASLCRPSLPPSPVPARAVRASVWPVERQPV